jgi:hypothetical protein
MHDFFHFTHANIAGYDQENVLCCLHWINHRIRDNFLLRHREKFLAIDSCVFRVVDSMVSRSCWLIASLSIAPSVS